MVVSGAPAPVTMPDVFGAERGGSVRAQNATKLVSLMDGAAPEVPAPYTPKYVDEATTVVNGPPLPSSNTPFALSTNATVPALLIDGVESPSPPKASDVATVVIL